MQSECTSKLFPFEAVERRSVVAGFDSGEITSNAGALLLGQVDRGLGLIRRFAQCFTDRRDLRYVEHRVETLVGQRILTWCWARKISTITEHQAGTGLEAGQSAQYSRCGRIAPNDAGQCCRPVCAEYSARPHGNSKRRRDLPGSNFSRPQ
jgi:hypothetical protein